MASRAAALVGGTVLALVGWGPVVLGGNSAAALWCPALHTIQGNDPSGPILVGAAWHVFVTCDTGPSWGQRSRRAGNTH